MAFGLTASLVSTAFSQTTFTYQGRLLDGGAPGNGLYDFQFTLHDAPAAGAVISSPITRDDVPVTNGLFTVELDFGAGAFDGGTRWLAMAARAGTNTGGYLAIPTRQALHPLPQSQFALVAGTVLDGAITADKIAPGQVVKSLNGLKDDVSLQPVGAVTLATNGNTLQIGVHASGVVTADSVMPVVLANDGIGSGLDADLLDGHNASYFATASQVNDRVMKDGDTMTGALTLQPFGGSAALFAQGNLSTGSAPQLALFRNDNTGGNVAPAVRIEHTGGTATNGALDVINRGSGAIARFNNETKMVASLDTEGVLKMTTAVASGAKSVLDLRNDGDARLASFGDAAQSKLWIDKDGNLTALGHVNAAAGLLTAGNLFVGGNATISGSTKIEGELQINGTVIHGGGAPIRILANGTVLTVEPDGSLTIDLDANGDLNLLARDVNLTALRNVKINGHVMINQGLEIPVSPPGVAKLQSDLQLKLESSSISLQGTGSRMTVDGTGVTVDAPAFTLDLPTPP
ncbi:MAG TPA: hypothetical protein DCY13_04000 [Verrucomicrobiales bacterium]|nr:hypothetical protein [Verrucomicrobiales bacterium]